MNGWNYGFEEKKEKKKKKVIDRLFLLVHDWDTKKFMLILDGNNFHFCLHLYFHIFN